jgi:Ca-activated chloride channel family protein
MGDFHFLRPEWLLGIAAAGALLWFLSRRQDVQKQWRGVIADHLLPHLIVTPASMPKVRPVHLTSTVLVLGSIAASGPTWEREQPPFVEDRAPLVIAIDLSETMDAVDVTPTRLERAKMKVRDILALRSGARTAIVAYAGSAHTVMPLTDDATLIGTYVDALETNIMPVRGRDTVRAIDAVEKALANEGTPGTVLFLTGGVEDAAFDRFAALRKDGNHQPIVLGIGTAEGGPVRIGEQTYLTDASGVRVFAKLDIDALHRLRDRAGVPVATVTADRSDVEWVERRVQSHLEARQAEANTRWKDEGWWLTIPLALLGALWFRKGWTIRWSAAGAVLLMLCSASPASAQSWRFADMWLTLDQQGQLAFNRGDYVTAADRFADPMWKGVALYRAGKFSESLDAFARVDSPEGDFNQGNALARLGRFSDAAERYRAAIARRPGYAEAKANLAIVLALIPPPEDKKEQPGDPTQDPDKVVFDDKGKKGKVGLVDVGEQTADVWMRNIQTTPAGLLRRKFALEAQEPEVRLKPDTTETK